MINGKMVGLLAAAFVAGSFFASPELRAYAANTVFSTDIVDGEVKTADLAANAVTSAKIKDGEVKTVDIAAGAVAAGRIADGAVGTLKIADNSVSAVDIATDAVGADELQGVTKLLFVSCPITIANFPAGQVGSTGCNVAGIQLGDHVVTTFDSSTTDPGRHCIVPTSSFAGNGNVTVRYRNACATAVSSTFNAEMIIFKN